MKIGIGLWVLAVVLLQGCDATEQNGATSARVVKPHLVEVVEVQPRAVALERTRSGTLRAQRSVAIRTQEAGRITALPGYPGDRVSAGELLAALDDTLLRAELARAQAGLREAQQNLARLRKLAAKSLVSNEDLLRRETEAEVAAADVRVLETRLSYTRILAPFDGVISERLSEPGNIAQAQTQLLTLLDPTRLVVDVTVSELVLAQLQVGDAVSVVVDALGAAPHSAHISRISPQVDPVTRRGALEVRLQPVPAGARAGQFVRVTLKTAERERLLVPFSALRFDADTYLYVLSVDGKAEQRKVITGSRLADEVEILEGLKSGDRVVTRGFLGLNAGKAVQVVGQPVAEPAATGAVSAAGAGA